MGEELNGGGQGAGVGGTQLKKARATLLSVGSRHTSSRVSRTHVASLKSPLSLTVAHTHDHPRHPTLPSLFEPFVLFSSAFVFFRALFNLVDDKYVLDIYMYVCIYIYVSRRAIFENDISLLLFFFFHWMEETKRNLYVMYID